MKNTKTLIPLVALTLVAAGCGEYSKDPVSDLETMRENSRIEIQKGPDKARVINNDVVRTEYIYVTKEESSIDDKFITITPPLDGSFAEGQAGQISIRAAVHIPGVEIKLTGQGLPEGARLEKSQKDKDIYILSWTPALYTIPTTAAKKTYSIKLVAEVVKANSAQELETLKGLVREKTFNIDLYRNQEAPSGLTVSGLESEVSEGSLIPFTVTVKVPGTDANAPKKPRLSVIYDRVSYTAGNSFLELDGSRHVVADLTKKDAEYVGDSKWKYTLIFDTKNISVQPQLAKDGTLIANADGTRVRLSFAVQSPYGLTTPETLVQVKIRYTKAIAAPRFDVSGLGQQALQAAPGQNITLKFFVASADAQAVTKVETAASTLAGSPKVECKDAATGAAKQECTLTWSVPCDAKAEALTGEIAMSAQSVVNGRNSDVTSYKLKVIAAQDDKKICAGAEAAK